MKEPFQIHITQSVLDDLKSRLAATSWITAIDPTDWKKGMNQAYLKELCDYWQNGFDWQRQETYLNRYRNYISPLLSFLSHEALPRFVSLRTFSFTTSQQLPMKHYFFIACLLLSSAAFCQQRIVPADAVRHAGDSVQVCGKIDDAKYLPTANGLVALLEMGGRYPNNALTVFIPPNLVYAFPKPPGQVYYKGTNMCFTSRIVLCDGKPQIAITQLAQMKEVTEHLAPSAAESVPSYQNN